MSYFIDFTTISPPLFLKYKSYFEYEVFCVRFSFCKNLYKIIKIPVICSLSKTKTSTHRLFTFITLLLIEKLSIS